MLVYTASKNDFINDVRLNQIEAVIQNEVLRKLNRNSPRNEILSWKNSLDYMFKILIDPEIPSSAGVAIEYNIPLTNRRVDFILTGKNSGREDTAVIIELKQWSEVEKTEKDGIVSTFINGSVRETSHPSYQAWSYAALINDYNETVRDEKISLMPCAYLHNLKSDQAIKHSFYADHIEKAPAFLSKDALRLSDFLKQHVKYGDSDDIMYRIEHGVIKPSKSLADSLASMLSGNHEFFLLDDQKVVYETAVDLSHRSIQKGKQTLIVKGGPGTGKSVVAINLLVVLTKREMLVQYVTKNSAPREVFKSMLTGTKKKTHIDNMFKGSGGYYETDGDFFDALIVDEAHRLNEKSGLYGNLGENQIKELIHCSKTSVFFIDEDQRVTLQDIGTVETIKKHARDAESAVTVMELQSQFRCNGSDGYLSWLDSALQIRETANTTLEGIDYDFRVFENPNKLRDAIFSKNLANNKARMVAGYCWDWSSKKDPEAFDIVIPEHDFKARWNLTSDGSLWVIAETSVKEVGCIHTCQGLEVDYIGVIIGEDLVVRNGEVITNATKRSRMDRSIRGYKSALKKDKSEAEALADLIIKNTYRTLMTRGMKGCYLYCVDKETQEFFQSFLHDVEATPVKQRYAGLKCPVVPVEEARPYEGFVPIYDIAAAAGGFAPQHNLDNCDWVQLPDDFATREGMFVIQVVGESMNKRIPNGSWCLFKENPGGTRNGKVVLVQHRNIEDPDHGGSYTVKRYKSEKQSEGEVLVNAKIILSPETHSIGYSDIVISEASENELMVIGELVAVIA